jgi:NAD(P)-dependent dehydrogenase (short-subunit alcohol dehydrogenase family)
MSQSPDRAAIVTGGGGAIGRHTAVELASRGIAVLVAEIDAALADGTVEAVRAVGGTALAAELDVSDDAAVAGAVALCEERFGGLDAYFNNAATGGAIAPITDYPLDDFDRVLAVNVRGVMLGMRHAIPAMRRRGGGSIVNVSSQAGLRGVPNLSAYSASKHAVIGLTRGASLEVAGDGIRVNAVAPGPTDTAMMRRIEDEVRQQGGDPAVFVDTIPVGRYGRPEEIAALVVWLLADAPPFLTGAVLPIDGGMTVR